MQPAADKGDNNINLLSIINIVNSVNNIIRNRLQDINNIINNTLNTAVKTNSVAVIKGIDYNTDATVHTELEIFIKDLNKVKTTEESVIKYNKSSIIKISVTVYSNPVTTTVLSNLNNVNYTAHTCKKTALNIVTTHSYLIINIVDNYIHFFSKK